MAPIILSSRPNNHKYFAEILLYFSVLLCRKWWDYTVLFHTTLIYISNYSVSTDAFLEFHPYIHLCL